MSFSRFHPLVQRWFTSTLGDPTPAQAQAGRRSREGRHTLIAAPTGSGKTLAAFLSAHRRADARGARVAAARRSPRRLRLAAQGAERRHPQEPRRAAPRHPPARRGRRGCRCRTSRPPSAPATRRRPSARRWSRTPPHILVTTPESLYLLLTSERSRQMLRTVRTVIVDEIHAVIGDAPRRAPGAVARAAAAGRGAPAAAHRPVGDAEADRGGRAVPHRRRPTAPSSTKGIAARWTWPSRCRARRSRRSWRTRCGRSTTIGSPRWSGRTARRSSSSTRGGWRSGVARHLSERLGDDAVTAHHGSLVEGDPARRGDAAEVRRSCARSSRRRRSSSASTSATSISSARSDRRSGSRRCCSASADPATPSAACRRVALFPTSRDDLVECAALLRAVAPRRARRHRAARSRARRPGAADRRRVRVARLRRGRALRAGPPRLAVPRPRRAPTSTPSWRWPPTVSTTRAAGARRSCTATRSTAGARPARRAAARAHLGRRDPGSRGLPGRARSRRHVRRHAERRLRDRDRTPATSFSSATRRGGSSRSPAAPSASPTRTGCRRPSRSGSARRRRAATSCRRRSATCGRTSTASCDTSHGFITRARATENHEFL